MPGSADLWRIRRTYRTDDPSSWLGAFYSAVASCCTEAHSAEDVARTICARAYDVFRAETITIARCADDRWDLLAGHDTDWLPPSLGMVDDADGPVYRPGLIVEIPDVRTYSDRWPHLRPLADRGAVAILGASFGTRNVDHGILLFISRGGVPYFAEDELTIASLFALVAGLAMDTVRTGA